MCRRAALSSSGRPGPARGDGKSSCTGATSAGAVAQPPRPNIATSAITEAAAVAARKPGLLVRTFGLSLANQWLPVGAVIALAVPLDQSVAWYWFAAIVPFVTLASLLPISIGGTGVREALFVALFGAVGMRAEVALALSLATLGVAVAWGLLGLALFAIGRDAEQPGASPS